MSDPLTGRTAIVTGAARGIGAATAHKLAALGASVIATDLDREPLEASVDAIRGDGGRCAPVVGDIGNGTVAAGCVSAAIEQFGGIDIIVNNAGFIWPQAIQRMSDQQFDALLGVHVKAPFLLLRAASDYLRSRARAETEAARPVYRKVVNVSSIIALGGAPMSVNYAASKAAVIGLTKALAREWGRYRVNVNAVAFGMIATRFNDPVTARDPVLKIGGFEVNIGSMGLNGAALEELIPLRRPGSVAEAAGAISLLCLPEADFVSGQVVVVSGGLE